MVPRNTVVGARDRGRKEGRKGVGRRKGLYNFLLENWKKKKKKTQMVHTKRGRRFQKR